MSHSCVCLSDADPHPGVVPDADPHLAGIQFFLSRAQTRTQGPASLPAPPGAACAIYALAAPEPQLGIVAFSGAFSASQGHTCKAGAEPPARTHSFLVQIGPVGHSLWGPAVGAILACSGIASSGSSLPTILV